MGRPSVVRVYFPLLTLLIVIPCATDHLRTHWRYIAVIGILIVGTLLNVGQLLTEAATSSGVQARAAKFISPESTVVWGDSFPYEYAFPVFTREVDVHDTRIYGLGVLTLAPFSAASADERAGKGLLARLRSEAGILLIATSFSQSLLNTYCIEHFGVPLRVAASTKTELWTIVNASCGAAAGPG